ncbi:hypothetical protein V3C99_016017, partial [Haemonchus contortus]
FQQLHTTKQNDKYTNGQNLYVGKISHV